MENFETLSVEQIFLTEMARTALKSSHLSSLVNIKSAFLPVRSGLTKSFAEDQRVLHHALVWQWEGSTQTLLSHRQYFFNFFIRNIRDISTLMITRVAANFQGILINGFGKHKERGDPTFFLRYEWKDEFGIVSQRFESSRGCPGVPVHEGIPFVFITIHGVMTQFVNVSFLCVPVHEDTTKF